MRRIKIHSNVSISMVRSKNGQKCVHCLGYMKYGSYALSVTKEIVSGNTMNLWIHINCFDDFCETIKRGIKENEKEIMVRQL